MGTDVPDAAADLDHQQAEQESSCLFQLSHASEV